MRALLLIAILLLAGCGQSGDLYLPPKEQPVPPPAETPTTPPAPAPEQQQEKDRK